MIHQSCCNLLFLVAACHSEMTCRRQPVVSLNKGNGSLSGNYFFQAVTFFQILISLLDSCLSVSGSVLAVRHSSSFSSIFISLTIIFLSDSDLHFRQWSFFQYWSFSCSDPRLAWIFVRQFFQELIFLLLEQWSSFKEIIFLEGVFHLHVINYSISLMQWSLFQALLSLPLSRQTERRIWKAISVSLL